MQRQRIVVLIVGLVVGACQSAAGTVTWQPVADTSAFDAAAVYDVAAGGTGFVAVGSISEAGHTVAAAWTSGDGKSWTRGPEQSGYKDRLFLRVVHRAAGFLAVAYDCSNGECAGSGIWASPDGLTWSSLGPINECCNIGSLAADATRVIAVGHDISTGNAVVYESADGTSWTPEGSDDGLAGAILGPAAFGGPGLVLVGSNGTGPSVWTSKDGLGWTASDAGSSLGSGEMRDVASSGSLIVSVGRDGGDAAAWSSKDGLTWTRASLSPALTGGTMDRVAGVGSLFVATGKDGAGGAIWSSSDGLTWTKATLGQTAAGGEFDTLAAGSTALVTFGVDAVRRVTILDGTPPH